MYAYVVVRDLETMEYLILPLDHPWNDLVDQKNISLENDNYEFIGYAKTMKVANWVIDYDKEMER